MEDSPEKKSLRSLLLEKRDSTSSDYLDIASKKIQKRLRKIGPFRDAQRVGAYFAIGSEIRTQDIIQELLSGGREVFLPKILGEGMEFRRIAGFSSLEKGSFDVMEPKDGCQAGNSMDVVLVPTVGVSPGGTRLGYGRGYYDRFLAKHGGTAVSLTLEKQVVNGIPGSDHDVPMEWIATEDRILRIGQDRQHGAPRNSRKPI